MSNVVIVESPSKAKTINKYLGDGYTVLASIGHIRDLPSKNGYVNPEENFNMVWETMKQPQRCSMMQHDPMVSLKQQWHVQVCEETWKQMAQGLSL